MLDELRDKPKSVRERYALWGALGTTGVVGLIWLVTFYFNFQADLFSQNDHQSAGAFSSFFSDLGNDISESWNNNVIEPNTVNTATSTEMEKLDEGLKNEVTASTSVSGKQIQIGTTTKSNNLPSATTTRPNP